MSFFFIVRQYITHFTLSPIILLGSELNVLNTVDFDKVHIDIIIAESVNRLKDKQKLGAEVRAFLQQKDYLVLKSVIIFKSDVFLHRRVCHRYNFPECQE